METNLEKLEYRLNLALADMDILKDIMRDIVDDIHEIKLNRAITDTKMNLIWDKIEKTQG